MRNVKNSFWLLGGAVLMSLGLGACEPTIKLALKVVPPCDQSDALQGVGTYRFEVTGSDIKAMGSNFSAAKGDGHITGLPLGEDVMVAVKAFAGDVEETPDVLNALPLAVGAAQPHDYTAESQERELSISVPVGKVDTFASSTDASKNSCTAMTGARHGHTATYLPKSGKVLIVGGAVMDDTGDEQILATAELYDPATGTFQELPEPPGGGRVYHAAVALPDGRALITGGIGVINGLVTTLGTGFIFDPSISGTRSPYTLVVMPSQEARAHHTATLSSTGNMVLLVGGCSTSNGICERDRADNAFSSTLIFDLAQFEQGSTSLVQGPSLPDSVGRVFHAALALRGDVNEGRILIAGGTSGGAAPVCRLALYDARQNAFLSDVSESLPAESCTAHLSAVLLDDNRVLLSGGYKQLTADGGPDAAQMTAVTTVWDPSASVRVTTGPTMSAPRAEHASFALPGGQALVVGGRGGGTVIAARLNLDSGQEVPVTGMPTSARVNMAAVQLGSGQPMLLGGIDPDDGANGTTQATAELYFYTP